MATSVSDSVRIEPSDPPPTTYDIVISGAGISSGWPSSVPAGDRLMQKTWGRLLRTGLTDDETLILEPVTKKLNRTPPAPIVLEALAQILLEHIGDQNVVVSTYVDVGTTAVNTNHVKLAALDCTQITLNMDHLLEQAGADVWHLHGEWDAPDSIVTFASQYRDGLPAPDRERLLDSLRGAKVLVVGYSGRDIDVMPILRASEPELLHWMHFSGALESTVVQVKSALGDRMRIFRGGVDHVSPGDVPLPDHDEDWVPGLDLYDRIGRDERMLACAAVASDVGEDGVALALLQNARMSGRPEITRRKVVSRIHSRRGAYDQALRVLAGPACHPATMGNSYRLLGELAEVLPRAGHPAAGRMLNIALSRAPQTADAARVRRARQHQVAGRLRLACDELKALCGRADAHERIKVAGLVDALTALADAQKMLGEYVDARDSLDQAAQLSLYANPSQHDATLRALAELGHISGVDTVLVPGQEPVPPHALLERIYVDARDREDQPLMFWASSTSADVASTHSRESMQQWLARAESTQPAHSATADCYLRLIAIEGEKRWGSPADAYEMAGALVQTLQGKSLGKARGFDVVARLTAAGCALAAGQTDGLHDSLRSVSRDAGSLGMGAIAARGDVVLHHLRGTRLGDDTLRAWSDAGWLWEIRAARAETSQFTRWSWPVVL